ncbi:hypothetical protein I4U23_025242 [Adineta vaga]|nr:hypothetical protein I4U23_025242 [Adineta vaga]
MSKLDFSVSPSCFRLIAFLFLLIVIVSARNIDSSRNDEDHIDNSGIIKQTLALDADLFSKINNNRPDRSAMSDFGFTYGHFPFYKKRTIPIELQKALYAHGIVGRRR